MARKTVSVEVPKLALARMAARFNFGRLVGNDLRDLLRTTAQEGATRARSRAPVLTGRTAGSVGIEIDHRIVPLWAKVTVDGTPGGGTFRYPYALDAAKNGPYVYKRGKRPGTLQDPYTYARGAKAGARTRRWFQGVRPHMRKVFQRGLERLARQIEAHWQQ